MDIVGRSYMWITLGVKGLTVALSSYFFVPFTHRFFFFCLFFFACLFVCLFSFIFSLLVSLLKISWIYARNCDADADFLIIFFQIIDHPLLNIIWVILILTYEKYSSNNTRNFANSIFFFFCSLIAIAASIGAAGIPGSGIMIIIVLQAVNLPLHDFGIIMAIEWMLWVFITCSFKLVRCIASPQLPRTDFHPISLDNITPESHVKVMRIKRMVAN